MTAPPVFVDHFAFTLGAATATVEEAAQSGRTFSSAAALRGAGFQLHHFCPPGVSAYSLARQTLQQMRETLHDVGAIIYATCIPVNASLGNPQQFRESRDVRHLMDFPASHLQAEFGLEHATVIGLEQQACTGMLGTLRLARALLLAEPELGRVLCVTADRFPEEAVYEQSYNLISDGAAACIVSREPGGFHLLAGHAVTNGALAQATADETAGSYFSYASRVIGETLDKVGLSVADIDYFLPQNTVPKVWQILARLVGFDYSRVYCPTLSSVGHVISSDNIINLCHLIASGRLTPGARVLLFMAGYGLNWQCVILERK
jgi:3-oxoacyl-[acyl-carrier-protein] synthase-3